MQNKYDITSSGLCFFGYIVRVYNFFGCIAFVFMSQGHFSYYYEKILKKNLLLNSFLLCD